MDIWKNFNNKNISLLSELYTYNTKTKSLTQSITKQTLRLVKKVSKSADIFEYCDKDIRYKFIVKYMKGEINRSASSVVVLDYNGDSSDVMPYGIWRRIIFFILDAFIVWNAYDPCNKKVVDVGISGGWCNGTWSDENYIHIKGEYNHDMVKKDIQTCKKQVSLFDNYYLFPLNSKPNKWEYENCEAPRDETNIEIKQLKDEENKFVISPIIVEQLHGAPYFYRSDKKAFLFMQYVEMNYHREEDYAPLPHYAYINDKFGLAMRMWDSWGRYDSKELFFYSDLQPTNKILVNGEIKDSENKNNWNIEFTVEQREELFFSLYDIYNIKRKDKKMRPKIKERKDDRYYRYYNKFSKVKQWDKYGLDGRDGRPLGWALGEITGLSSLSAYSGWEGWKVNFYKAPYYPARKAVIESLNLAEIRQPKLYDVEYV